MKFAAAIFTAVTNTILQGGQYGLCFCILHTAFETNPVSASATPADDSYSGKGLTGVSWLGNHKFQVRLFVRTVY